MPKKFNILSISAVGFLTLSLIAVTMVASNPELRQLISSYAKEKAGGRVRNTQDIGSPRARKEAESALRESGNNITIEEAIQIGTGKAEEEKTSDACSGLGNPDARQACRTGAGAEKFEGETAFDEARAKIIVEQKAAEEKAAIAREEDLAGLKSNCLQEGGFWENNSCSYQEQQAILDAVRAHQQTEERLAKEAREAQQAAISATNEQDRNKALIELNSYVTQGVTPQEKFYQTLGQLNRIVITYHTESGKVVEIVPQNLAASTPQTSQIKSVGGSCTIDSNCASSYCFKTQGGMIGQGTCQVDPDVQRLAEDLGLPLISDQPVSVAAPPPLAPELLAKLAPAPEPQPKVVYDFADCHRSELTPEQIQSCNESFNWAYNLPLVGNYVQSYAPDKVAYAWEKAGYSDLKACWEDLRKYGPQAAASCNTYDLTKEQAISTIELGSAITAAGAVAPAIITAAGAGGAAAAAGTSIFGSTLLGTAGTAGTSLLVSVGAITTMQQTFNAAIAHIEDPGSSEAWKQTGLAALSWANLRTADILIKAFSTSTSTAAQIAFARDLNTGVSLVNVFFDTPTAYYTCRDNPTLKDCGGAISTVVADFVFGALDVKQGQLGFTNPFKSVEAPRIDLPSPATVLGPARPQDPGSFTDFDARLDRVTQGEMLFAPKVNEISSTQLTAEILLTNAKERTANLVGDVAGQITATKNYLGRGDIADVLNPNELARFGITDVTSEAAGGLIVRKSETGEVSILPTRSLAGPDDLTKQLTTSTHSIAEVPRAEVPAPDTKSSLSVDVEADIKQRPGYQEYVNESNSIRASAFEGEAEEISMQKVNKLIDNMTNDGIDEFEAITFAANKIQPQYASTPEELAQLTQANRAKTFGDLLVCPYSICRHNQTLSSVIARNRSYNTFTVGFNYGDADKSFGHMMTGIISADSPSGLILLDSTNNRVFRDPQEAANLFVNDKTKLTKAFMGGKLTGNEFPNGSTVDVIDLLKTEAFTKPAIQTTPQKNNLAKWWDEKIVHGPVGDFVFGKPVLENLDKAIKIGSDGLIVPRRPTTEVLKLGPEVPPLNRGQAVYGSEGEMIEVGAEIATGGEVHVYEALFGNRDVIVKYPKSEALVELVVAKYDALENMERALVEAGRPDLAELIQNPVAKISLTPGGEPIGYLELPYTGQPLSNYVNHVNPSPILTKAEAEQLLEIADILDTKGLQHRDIFLGNIIKENGKFIIIDPATFSMDNVAVHALDDWIPPASYSKNIYFDPDFEGGKWIYVVPDNNREAFTQMFDTFNMVDVGTAGLTKAPLTAGIPVEIPKTISKVPVASYRYAALAMVGLGAVATDYLTDSDLDINPINLLINLFSAGNENQNARQSINIPTERSPKIINPEAQPAPQPEPLTAVPYRGYLSIDAVPEKDKVIVFVTQIFNDYLLTDPNMTDVKGFITYVREKLAGSQYAHLLNDKTFTNYLDDEIASWFGHADRLSADEIKTQLTQCVLWAVVVSKLYPELDIVADRYNFTNASSAFYYSTIVTGGYAALNSQQCFGKDMKAALSDTRCSGKELTYYVQPDVIAYKVTNLANVNKGDAGVYGNHMFVVLEKYLINGKIYLMISEANSPKGALDGTPQTYIISEEDFASRVNPLDQTYFLRASDAALQEATQPTAEILDLVTSGTIKNARIVESSVTQTQDENKTEAFTYYSQFDEEWAGIGLAGGDCTWANKGCTIMAAAMATDLNPIDYKNQFNAYYGYGPGTTTPQWDCKGSTLDDHREFIGSLGYTIIPIDTSQSMTEIKNEIESYTDNGIPVWLDSDIWMPVKGENQWVPHVALVVDVDESNVLVLNDSARGEEVTTPDNKININGGIPWKLYAIVKE